MSYQNYSIEDFLADESFQQYCSGTDDAAIQFWDKVLEEQPGVEERFMEAVRWYGILNAGQGNLQEQTARLLKKIKEEVYYQPSKVKPMYKTWWAAAAVLLVLATGSYFLFRQDSNKEIVKTNKKQPVIENDIAPGGNKAILTLADGSEVVLDTATNGAITRQGGVTVIKLDGQLAYNKEGNISNEVFYNTITTPKGGQYQLILADGSKVWLNAASSLRFPTAFVGTERKVELTGEGYFEVAKPLSPKGEQRIPFIVKFNSPSGHEGEVEVLGTHFNVNSYTDEENIKITLLEGSVKVMPPSTKGGYAILKPGEQAQVSNSPLGDGGIKVVDNVNVEEAVAWKNGKFIFQEIDIQSVMRQLARWYDVEVDYKGNLPDDEYIGVLSRTEKISAILNFLKATKTVSFSINGRKVTVMPYKK